MKKRIISIVILGLSFLLCGAAAPKDGLQIVDETKPLLDLDKAIEFRIPGSNSVSNNSEEVNDNENIEELTENEHLSNQESIEEGNTEEREICVSNNTLYYRGKKLGEICNNNYEPNVDTIEMLEQEIADKSREYTLADDWAESHSFKIIIKELENKEIKYKEICK